MLVTASKSTNWIEKGTQNDKRQEEATLTNCTLHDNVSAFTSVHNLCLLVPWEQSTQFSYPLAGNLMILSVNSFKLSVSVCYRASSWMICCGPTCFKSTFLLNSSSLLIFRELLSVINCFMLKVTNLPCDLRLFLPCLVVSQHELFGRWRQLFVTFLRTIFLMAVLTLITLNWW